MKLIINSQTKDTITKLETIEHRLGDLKPIMGWVHARLVRSTHQTWRAQGRPDRWAGWAESTRKKRERLLRRGHGFAKKPRNWKDPERKRRKSLEQALAEEKILVFTGMLRQSVRGDGGKGNEQTIETIDERQAVLGTSLSYAPYVNDDRPFLLLQDEDKMEIRAGIEEFILLGTVAGARP